MQSLVQSVAMYGSENSLGFFLYFYFFIEFVIRINFKISKRSPCLVKSRAFASFLLRSRVLSYLVLVWLRIVIW